MFEIEKLYQMHGIENYKLRDIQDLYNVHGINFKDINGYNELDDINKNIYVKFIVNFFNACGIESRTTLIPKGIYFVEQTEYLLQENPNDDSYLVIGGIVESIDKHGIKKIIHQWDDENYKDIDPTEKESSKYLRFEYSHGNRIEWQHIVKSGEQWY